ncbi:xanthine dehydrogenase, partial [Martensiomyces pterosporus]
SFDPEQPLVEYLRKEGLTGTKVSCGEGACGACTVMVSQFNLLAGRVEHRAINSCITPLYALDGKHVVTVEGIGNQQLPHPVQERIALLHGTQCGFCTPGFSMSLYTLLRNQTGGLPSEAEVEQCLSGNLCRCTGYRPILDAAKTLARDNAWNSGVGGGVGCGRADCCRLAENGACGQPSEDGNSSKCLTKAKFRKYDASQELIFPPSLLWSRTTLSLARQPTAASRTSRIYRPLTLADLHAVRASHPDSALVAGGTMPWRNEGKDTLVYLGDIDELKGVDLVGGAPPKLVVGSSVTFAQLLDRTRSMLAPGIEQIPYASHITALHDCLARIAGPQVRNAATIGGHVAGCPSASDLLPVLLALGASIVCRSMAGAHASPQRTLQLSEYVSGSMAEPNDMVTEIHIPLPSETPSGAAVYVQSLKQSMRKANDSAVVSCGMRVCVDLSTGKVSEATFAFSGVRQDCHVLAHETAQMALGKLWTDQNFIESGLLEQCAREIAAQLTPNTDRAKYRVALATSLLYRFWSSSCQALRLGSTPNGSGAEQLSYQPPQPVISQQTFAPVMEDTLIGKGEPHVSSLKHATGEAVYVDDMPPFAGEYHLGLVMSTRAHARILSIDATKCLAIEGVYPKLFTAKDIPGTNLWNIRKDQEILSSGEVHFHGQFIAAIIAKDRETARRAADLVAVEYEDLPAVFTVDDAIRQKSFFNDVLEVEGGDVDQAFEHSDHVFEGEARCGAQEHFYMEPHAIIVVPKGEDSEMDVYATTQSQKRCQEGVAEAMGVPMNRITCHVKRIGGGFGGKDSLSDPIASISAVAASHAKRPVRAVLTRTQDMRVTGQRHPYLGRWKLGVNKNGKVTAFKVDLYSNGGFSYDCSTMVMMVSLSSCEGCYYFPNAKFTGRVCKTNIQSSTAFRGFGACQAEFICESMMAEVAEKLGIPVVAFREMNLYKEGSLTPSRYPLHDWTLPQMFAQLQESAEYEARHKAVQEFNAKSMFRKRGIALLPTKHGITFGIRSFNEAAAMIHIYLDGTVLVHHHGVEMGQGLHTKMSMIAADALGIPLESVYVKGSSTDVLANPTPSGASFCTDLNGGAVLKACRALASRLKPYRECMPSSSFADIALAAYMDQIDLSERSFFKLDKIPENFADKRGFDFFYYTQGVAISEVELDTLTGSHTIRRVDILMDVGRSINKALDIGQIEGAFMQGVGWATSEEWMLDTQDGSVFTRRPALYRVPTAMDIPRDFRVAILEGVEYKHSAGVHSARAIGEPPLFLGASVFFALREAVKAATAQATGDGDIIHMDIPATCETLRMACKDNITHIADMIEAQGLLAGSTIQRI